MLARNKEWFESLRGGDELELASVTLPDGSAVWTSELLDATAIAPVDFYIELLQLPCDVPESRNH